MPARPGGAQIEDEYAVIVDLGLVELHGMRQDDAVLAKQPVATHHYSGAVAPLGGIGVAHGFCGRFEADPIVYLVVENQKSGRLAKHPVRDAVHNDVALPVHRHVDPGMLRRNIAPFYLDPFCTHMFCNSSFLVLKQ